MSFYSQDKNKFAMLTFKYCTHAF